MLTELKIWKLENNISRDKINNYYDELKTALVAGKVPDLKKDPFKSRESTFTPSIQEK